MFSVMTSPRFEQLQPGDRASVKPHASPVLHSPNYLLGELDEKYLTTLREYRVGVVPEPLEGSRHRRLLHRIVGIGATAPIWGTIRPAVCPDHHGHSR